MTGLNMDEFVTILEAAEMAGYKSDKTVYKLLKQPSKKFPRPVRLGKSNFFYRTEIEAWVDARLKHALENRVQYKPISQNA